MKIATILAVLAASVAVPALAVPVYSTGYDMPNGATGSYVYWDGIYNGSGCTTCNGAYLSGGSGKLTDGIVATTPWYDYPTASDLTGTGQYVGWVSSYSPDPTITFHFAGSPTINSIALQIDDSIYGGVGQPGAIWVDGNNVAFTPLATGTIGWITLTGLNLTGNTHTVQLFNGTQPWIFSSEVTFDGRTGGGVPEPASWALMLSGFGLAGGALRARRRGVFAA